MTLKVGGTFSGNKLLNGSGVDSLKQLLVHPNRLDFLNKDSNPLFHFVWTAQELLQYET